MHIPDTCTPVPPHVQTGGAKGVGGPAYQPLQNCKNQNYITKSKKVPTIPEDLSITWVVRLYCYTHLNV